ncbi:aspartate carbamoyltransferase regulatory subunit, partial [Candidatus Woesearchaeota archaeon]|nr:aspartate carbamoyltransferase regulatory subunit [Candidatus Woesearchaeota archaeon]
RLVGVQTKMDIYRQGVVKSRKRPDVRKGVLMIEDRYLTESEVRQVAAIAPGATINDIRDGNVVLKRDLLSPPMLEDLPFLKCTNTGCITYGEHNEHVAPKAVRVGDERSGLYKCDYCNNLMESHEMF